MLSPTLVASLRLIRTERIGPKTYQELINVYGTAEKALEYVADLSLRGGRKTPIRLASQKIVEEEIEATHAFGAQYICVEDAHYPTLLRHIADPPPVLVALGRQEWLKHRSIAMVGARNASNNAVKLAELWAHALGRKKHVITSGMARGIDAAAHKAALDTGTIAVLGGGINHIYPKENKAIYDRLSEEGLILSEHPLGMLPRPEHFPRRNRIISGLSLGVVVVEAAQRSGSLITARMALEQGREVMAVPGFPLDPRAEGANHLIRQGAKLVSSPSDVLDALSQSSIPPVGLAEKDAAHFHAPHNTAMMDDTILAGMRHTVLDALQSSPSKIDDLAQHLSLPLHLVRIVLLELELAGRLARHPGDQVSLSFDDSSLTQ